MNFSAMQACEAGFNMAYYKFICGDMAFEIFRAFLNRAQCRKPKAVAIKGIAAKTGFDRD